MKIRQKKQILPFSCLLMLSLISSALCAQSPNSSLQQQSKYLLEQNFQGTWRVFTSQSTSPSSSSPILKQQPWNQLQVREGLAFVTFTKGQNKDDIVATLSIDFLMPRYQNKKVFRLLFNLSQSWNATARRWDSTNESSISVVYQIYNETSLIIQSPINNLQYQIDKSLLTLNLPQTSHLLLSYKPTYLSPLTSFFFSLYSFLVYTLFLHKKPTQPLPHPQPLLTNLQVKHSIVSIILSTVMSFMIFVCQFLIGIRSLFGKMSPEVFFTVAAFWNFAITYRMCRNYWGKFFRRSWGIFVIWAIACGYIWFILFFRHNEICLIINSLIFIPQISYHCLKGRKVKADLRLILYMLSNQMYFLYFKSCPSNMFYQSPSYRSAFCICSLLIAQTLVLLGQIYLSPRFFIPYFLRPTYHLYYDLSILKQKDLQNNENRQCHICLQQIKIEKDEKNGKISNKNKQIMITPCKHMFHSACLEKWMFVQMICPVDRLPLPAV